MREELKPWIALIAVVAVIGGIFFVFGVPSREGDKPLIDSLQKSIEIKNAEIAKMAEKIFELEQGTSLKKSEKHSLTISIQNLKKIAGNHFEVWAIEGEKKFSIANFNVNDKEEIINLAGYKQNTFFEEKDLSNVNSFEISIEPDNDFNPAQSETILFSGNLSGSNAFLKFAPVKPENISASFILSTPTNGFPPENPSSNEESGLWFVEDENVLQSSLNLPFAVNGWKYESWIYLVDIPVSLGKFVDSKKTDDFNGLSERLRQGFNAPGEDLLLNALSIGLTPNEFPVKLNRGDYLVKVSLEPEIDGKDLNGKQISQFVLFDSIIPLNADTYTNYSIEPSNNLPNGTITIN